MMKLNQEQLERLTSYIRLGASNASVALSTWLERDVRISMDQLEQVPLEMAHTQLGTVDEIVAACCMRITGGIRGLLILGFDDTSGLTLCDTLLARKERSTQWGELEVSAVMETTNIAGCAVLNSLYESFPKKEIPGDLQTSVERESWIPTPPTFVRDYAASIMQFAIMDQACDLEDVLVSNTTFTVDGLPIRWRLLLIPDAVVLRDLARTLR
jgi:chemotaxis protein CheC